MALLGIDDTLHELLTCVSARLDSSGSPVCSVGASVGMPAIASCCECGDAADGGGEGELWGHVQRVFRSTEAGVSQAIAQKPCAPSQWAAEYLITLARCFPVIDERGDLPAVDDRTSAAGDTHADIAAIQRALHCCTATEPPYLESIAVQTDPQGGCSYLVATVRVPVSMRPGDNARAE